MAAERVVMTLAELCDLQGGSVFKPEFQGRPQGEYPFVKVSDMNLAANAFALREANHWVSESDMRALGARVVPPGAVVFAKIGEALRANRLRHVVQPTLIDNNMMAAVPRPESIDPRYFYYAMSQIDFNTVAQGTALPYLTQKTLETVPLLVVRDRGEQRRIAHILGTLDDKIELNRRMNDTLEAMARALFKSWFVDYDPVRAKADGRDTGLPKHLADLFPDRLVDSELGEIPEGWPVSALGDLVEFAYGKPLKAEDRRPGPFPVVGSNGPVGVHSEALVPEPGIVVGRKGTPGAVTWVDSAFFPIDTTFFVRLRNGLGRGFLVYFLLRDLKLARLSADSAVPGLNRHSAYMQSVCIPPSGLLYEFEEAVAPLFVRYGTSRRNSNATSELRDALLRVLVGRTASGGGDR